MVIRFAIPLCIVLCFVAAVLSFATAGCEAPSCNRTPAFSEWLSPPGCAAPGGCQAPGCQQILQTDEIPPPQSQGTPKKPPELIDGAKLPSSTTESGTGSSGAGGSGIPSTGSRGPTGR